MLELLNHRLFAELAAPPDLTGSTLLLALLLAEWAIFAGPALLVLLWVFGEECDRRAAVIAFLSSVLALATAHGISSFFMHPRPFMDGYARNYLNHVSDSSFPSDHCTLLLALGFSLMFVPPRNFRKLWVVPFALAIAVGWSRVFLGAHYPMDVAGAAIVAFLSTWLVTRKRGRVIGTRLTRIGEWLYAWPMSWS